MLKEYFEDFYGFTYSLLHNTDGRVLLTARFPSGGLYLSKTYSTERGARIALGKISEGTARLTERTEVV